MNEDRFLQFLERTTVSLARAVEKAMDRAVERLISSRTQTLGFCDPPEPKYVFVERRGDSLWHFVDFEKDKTIPIPHRALTGIITKLKITATEYEGESTPKLDIYFQADSDYIVRTGAKTSFAKGFLLALNELSPSQLKNPVTIEVKPSEKKGTINFCRVYQNGESIRAEWEPNADWDGIIDKIQCSLSILHEDISQDEPKTKPRSTNPSIEWEEYDYQAEDEELNYQEILPPPSLRTAAAPPLVSYSAPRRSHPAHLTRDRLMEISLQECKRVGLTSRVDGSRHLQSKYRKNTRQELSDEELLDFVGFLQSLPSAVR